MIFEAILVTCLTLILVFLLVLLWRLVQIGGAPVEIGSIVAFGPPALHLEARLERSIVRGVCVRQVLEIDAVTVQRARAHDIGSCLRHIELQALDLKLVGVVSAESHCRGLLRWEWTS